VRRNNAPTMTSKGERLWCDGTTPLETTPSRRASYSGTRNVRSAYSGSERNRSARSADVDYCIRRNISERHEEFDRTGIERREFQKRAWIGMCGSGNVLRADSNFADSDIRQNASSMTLRVSLVVADTGLTLASLRNLSL
jgi:hypothetical protein